MKVLVAVKRVVDFNVSIRVKSDGSGVDTDNVVMSMNPFDENAVEEAIRMKEQGVAEEIIAVSIGTDKSQDVLRKALAMGVDKGILLKTEESLEPLTKAKLLAKVVEQESPQVVLMGKQTIDGDSNQTGQMLAAILGWPQGTNASTLDFNDDQLKLTRETDLGLETLEMKLPVVITTDLRLNEARFANLPAIMKARKKPLEILEAESLDVDLSPRLKIKNVSKPPKREAGVILSGTAELIEKLTSRGALN